MKVVQLRRWEVAIAFVAMVVLSVALIAWQSSVSHSAHTAARQARAASLDAKRAVVRLRRDERQLRGLVHANRRRALHNTSALRSVLCLAEDQTLAETNISGAQRRRALDFYRKALHRIHAAPCPAPIRPKS